MQITWAEKACRERVLESGWSPTSVPSSAVQVSALSWREPQQSAATKEDASPMDCSAAGSPGKPKSIFLLSSSSFILFF